MGEFLAALRTDFIDLLWLHMWDYTTPIEEIVRALDDLVRAGLRQLEDNLGCLDFELDGGTMERLEAASGFEPGFPGDFLESANIRKLICGEKFPLLDDPRRGGRC